MVWLGRKSVTGALLKQVSAVMAIAGLTRLNVPTPHYCRPGMTFSLLADLRPVWIKGRGCQALHHLCQYENQYSSHYTILRKSCEEVVRSSDGKEVRNLKQIKKLGVSGDCMKGCIKWKCVRERVQVVSSCVPQAR